MFPSCPKCHSIYLLEKENENDIIKSFHCNRCGCDFNYDESKKFPNNYLINNQIDIKSKRSTLDYPIGMSIYKKYIKRD